MIQEEIESKMVVKRLQKNKLIINKIDDKKLDDIIHEHSVLLFELYKTNRLFYKTVFKAHRFNLAALILTISFEDESSFSEVMRRFMPLNLMSKNSVSNFFNMLVFTGRIKTTRNINDTRKINFHLTEKLKKETYLLITTMTQPLSINLNFGNLVCGSDAFLRSFFYGFSRLVINNLFFFDSVPHANIFINRDGGHAIILCLFCEKVKITDNRYLSIKVNDMTNKCGVSRSHILKILDDMKAVGFIAGDISNNRLILTGEFCDFARDYFRLYFSFCMMGMID
ncbi:hypothetical protein [Klebsiella pneumoniae]|uniref:hypothetical protein n=1 Tax=Klebsiella pneumoniae TaxID=573 RepID=UPI000DE6C6AD|nr:hypothetical protein [Klebsiella pneumoniae]SSH85070.1 Uncharacterised protein [Klebsiella pneumoniae]